MSWTESGSQNWCHKWNLILCPMGESCIQVTSPLKCIRTTYLKHHLRRGWSNTVSLNDIFDDEGWKLEKVWHYYWNQDTVQNPNKNGSLSVIWIYKIPTVMFPQKRTGFISRLYITADKEKKSYNTTQDCRLSSEVIRDKGKATHHITSHGNYIMLQYKWVCKRLSSWKTVQTAQRERWSDLTLINKAIVTVQEGRSQSLPPPSTLRTLCGIY